MEGPGRVVCEPGMHESRLVGGQVVKNHMDLGVRSKADRHMIGERTEILGAVAVRHLSDHPAGRDIVIAVQAPRASPNWSVTRRTHQAACGALSRLAGPVQGPEQLRLVVGCWPVVIHGWIRRAEGAGGKGVGLRCAQSENIKRFEVLMVRMPRHSHPDRTGPETRHRRRMPPQARC